ncbi:MAG: L,D-transpeptidase [Sphingomonas bacterium]|uniref:L,D-transpeptidase n=1 Tax=Sphingomonas bacterium TaxID=1895847 RepID=UPI00260CC4AF|nr:L,D-transpeptidase [Sphingomonas bacterium]MDB5696707.1 L,D-transpeptidase [Sphingomonas bacterium]
MRSCPRPPCPSIRASRRAIKRACTAALAIALAIVGDAPLAAQVTPTERAIRAEFGSEAASEAVRGIADWIVASGDHQGLPFMIVDKVGARVFVFARNGRVAGATSALLGMGIGDESVPDIGKRRLATIRPHERTTPAGRHQAALGFDLEQDVLWVDYDQALSLHRVIDGKPADRRRERLASASPLDNRISYGCINVPAAFYDGVVIPAFTGTVGIVYILPETRALADVFPAMRRAGRR